MIELIVTHKDGRQMCHVLRKGEVYEMRGDEVGISASVVKRKK